MRQNYFYLGFAYLIFVIYGSLVPLEFHARPWDEALQAFVKIPYLDLGIQSRADWVANILLFIPLTFVWLEVLGRKKSLAIKLFCSIFILGAGMALSIAIEFTQLFFPQRTVSLNDIVAECAGACIGIALWWMYGKKLYLWLSGWNAAKGNVGLAERLLYLYLFILFFYNLMPLDLTISPVEIYHKWQDGKVVLLPFSFVFLDIESGLYGVLSDVLIWAPVAVLWRLASQRTGLAIVLYVTLASALLEFLQLFVFSRISNVTQIITAGLGAMLGLQLARFLLPSKTNVQPLVMQNNKMWLWVLMVASWMVVLMIVFWYPFNFAVDHNVVRGNLQGMFRIPFVTYYFGTEYRAITELFHKVAFFAPLGAFLALLLRNISIAPIRFWLHPFFILWLVLFPFGIELGQTFLPGKIADSTDWALACFGAMCAYFVVLRMTSLQPNAEPQQVQQSNHIAVNLLRSVCIGILVLLVILWVVTHLPQAPYNVRKLLASEYQLLSLGLLSGFVYWTVAVPVWFSISQKQTKMVVPFAVVVFIHAVIAWLLVRYAVPVEMIEKVAASPILGWWWEWELIGRFMALYAVFSIAITTGAMFVVMFFKSKAQTSFGYWLMNVLFMFPILYWLVISNAATDNIVELLADNASIGACIAVVSAFVVVFFAGSAIAASFNPALGRLRIILIVSVILSFPVAYFLLSLGTEQYIFKYEQVFSALQFLLSTDRAHYASTAELLLRYCIVHGIVVCVVGLIQRPFFLALAHSTKEAPNSALR